MQRGVKLEQRSALQFCARLGRTASETQQLLNSAYQQDAPRKAATRTYLRRFQTLGIQGNKNSKTNWKMLSLKGVDTHTTDGSESDASDIRNGGSPNSNGNQNTQFHVLDNSLDENENNKVSVTVITENTNENDQIPESDLITIQCPNQFHQPWCKSYISNMF
ncbi:unnamed protein product [Meganyctiphanes norvegica]|uniref:Mos1 transposase HTH domain-containing protein n=1 Tax=Meganyctiphanes norvegica TaxID=48144 RepID=A0AAV2S4N0_MEGNR